MSFFLQAWLAHPGLHTCDFSILAQNVCVQMQTDINFPETIKYSITVIAYRA